MNATLKEYDGRRDGDLIVCEQRGVAFQCDMRADPVAYDDDYYSKVMRYDGSRIAKRVNSGRIDLVLRFMAPGSSILDIGAGTGGFMRDAEIAGFHVRGFDVIPRSVDMLRARGVYADEPALFDAVTMWDVIEHLVDPSAALRDIPHFIFCSLPIFDRLSDIRNSKHYRPGEHLYYWTDTGFVEFMGLQGFVCAARSDHENKAGRESIGAYAFRRVVAPDQLQFCKVH